MTHICPCLILRSAHFSSTNAYRMSVMGWVLGDTNHCHFTHLKKEKRKKILFWTHLSLQLHASYSPLQQNSLLQLFTLWFLSLNSLLNLLQSTPPPPHPPPTTTFLSGHLWLDPAKSNGWVLVLNALSPVVVALLPGNTMGHSSLLLCLLPCQPLIHAPLLVGLFLPSNVKCEGLQGSGSSPLFSVHFLLCDLIHSHNQSKTDLLRTHTCMYSSWVTSLNSSIS